MDDARGVTVLRTLSGSATRRGMLIAVAALAGLHLGEATAKRRRGRAKQARVQTHGRGDPPKVLVIEATKPGGPFTGDFAATGAFVDEGTFEVVDSLITGTQSDRLLNNHLTYEFTSEHGTFLIASQNRITFGETSATVDGHWRVTGGTGDYAGLRGAGALVGTSGSAGIFHLMLTGRVQLA